MRIANICEVVSARVFRRQKNCQYLRKGLKENRVRRKLGGAAAPILPYPGPPRAIGRSCGHPWPSIVAAASSTSTLIGQTLDMRVQLLAKSMVSEESFPLCMSDVETHLRSQALDSEAHVRQVCPPLLRFLRVAGRARKWRRAPRGGKHLKRAVEHGKQLGRPKIAPEIEKRNPETPAGRRRHPESCARARPWHRQERHG